MALRGAYSGIEGKGVAVAAALAAPRASAVPGPESSLRRGVDALAHDMHAQLRPPPAQRPAKAPAAPASRDGFPVRSSSASAARNAP